MPRAIAVTKLEQSRGDFDETVARCRATPGSLGLVNVDRRLRTMGNPEPQVAFRRLVGSPFDFGRVRLPDLDIEMDD